MPSANSSSITGRLLDPEGEARAGVVITFVPGSAVPVHLFPTSRRIQVTTDANGNFGVELSKGIYRVIFDGKDIFKIVVPANGGFYSFASCLGNPDVVPAPVNFAGNIPGEDLTLVTWSCEKNPALDFKIYGGITQGGPYPNFYTALPAQRATQFNNGFLGSGQTGYFIIVARNSESEVSVPSNELALVQP